MMNLPVELKTNILKEEIETSAQDNMMYITRTIKIPPFKNSLKFFDRVCRLTAYNPSIYGIGWGKDASLKTLVVKIRVIPNGGRVIYTDTYNMYDRWARKILKPAVDKNEGMTLCVPEELKANIISQKTEAYAGDNRTHVTWTVRIPANKDDIEFFNKACSLLNPNVNSFKCEYMGNKTLEVKLKMLPAKEG